MAREWSAFLTVICIFMHLNKADAAENLNCRKLEDVFKTCQCRADTKNPLESIVDCSSMRLTAVPIIDEPYNKPIYKLVLRNNSITTLTDNSFQGLQIEYIDLSENSLDSVSNNTFHSMKDTLHTLEIDGDGKVVPPINALNKLNVIHTLTMRHYNKPILDPSDKLFLKFTGLKSLTLDDWNIQHIEASSFLGLDGLQSLTLLNQKLEFMPVDGLRDDPFDNLETLQISNTQIKTVTYGVFSNLSKLKNLDLSNNEIEALEENCFIGVIGSLEKINLHFNNLDNSNGKLKGLSGMTALKELDFSKNIFQTIPSMPNLGVTKPFSLVLHENNINQVLENAFMGYAAYLKDLDLTINSITAMHANSFKGVSQLKSLYLQNQQGQSGDTSALQLPISLTNSASTLQSINLSGQKVDGTKMWEVVKEMTALENLNLNSIELHSIPDLIFEKVTALEHIDLGYNSLGIITQNSLAGARQLKTLNLEGNIIQTIPACLFYGFLSNKITLGLGLNPIKCDCGIHKLLEDVQSGGVEFDSLKAQPRCTDSTLLSSIQPSSLGCTPTDPECVDHYTTTPIPITTEPVTRPAPQITLRVLEVGKHTIKASWSLSDRTNLQRFKFDVSSPNNVEEFIRDNLMPTVSSKEATGLTAGTTHTVCITAFFTDRPYVHACEINKTDSSQTPGKQNLDDDDSDSANTGIIVGCVVAGVALIGIVIAVVILLVFRKKPKQVPDNYRPPTQPRSYAKAELPSMSDGTRKFAKPKKNGKEPHPGNNMQVVAISDGQTSPGPRVGRVNMMFQPEDGYEPMKNFKKGNRSPDSSMYENDHGALPPTPGQDSRPPSYPGATGGYYNQGYNEDKYDEIEVEI